MLEQINPHACRTYLIGDVRYLRSFPGEHGLSMTGQREDMRKLARIVEALTNHVG